MDAFCKSLCLLLALAWSQQCTAPKQAAHLPSPRLVWSDEFDRPGLPDSTRWTYDSGTGCPDLCGWGNQELQHYTAARPQNARVEGGCLLIEAQREDWQGSRYTSARLLSKHKGDWKYGRIEARIKCPVGRGTWPAFWMLPTHWAYGGWPRSGEIDIMEHVGYQPDSVYGTVHTQAFNHLKNTQRSGALYLPDAEQAFHLYAIEWRPDRIDFFVDDLKYHSFANLQRSPDEWPFDQPFHLILNLAVGGGWG
ncbi:MAG TPA: glycoside hydrolase family 16 protein, partial [Saprospiraceae bacterium]|nr:glycoside hydrolase family 16 protein [Saprospiraceae bacterium]